MHSIQLQTYNFYLQRYACTNKLSVELRPRVRGKKYEQNAESSQVVRRLDEFIQVVLEVTCKLSGVTELYFITQ